MKVPDAVRQLEMEMDESQNQRDARVEQLWRNLDVQGKGELDWKGLQKGLRKIDHRQQSSSPPFSRSWLLAMTRRDTDCLATALKNADDLLKSIIKVVDTNGDGKIQYEGRRP